ncbi:MAG: hypothetical protein ACHQ4H_16605, partial [Ktedonobacterales bacterium]
MKRHRDGRSRLFGRRHAKQDTTYGATERRKVEVHSWIRQEEQERTEDQQVEDHSGGDTALVPLATDPREPAAIAQPPKPPAKAKRFKRLRRFASWAGEPLGDLAEDTGKRLAVIMADAARLVLLKQRLEADAERYVK